VFQLPACSFSRTSVKSGWRPAPNFAIDAQAVPAQFWAAQVLDINLMHYALRRSRPAAAPPAGAAAAAAAGTVLADLFTDESYLALHNGYMCSGSQLLSLARRCLQEAAVCCNIHPKNLMLLSSSSSSSSRDWGTADSSSSSRSAGVSSANAGFCDWEANEGQLLLLDIGCDWAPADPCKLLR
jgi:hypothetical protein